MAEERKLHPAFPEGVDIRIKDEWLDRLADTDAFTPLSAVHGDGLERANIVLVAVLFGEDHEFEETAYQARSFLALWGMLPCTRLELIYNSAENGLHEYRNGWQPLGLDPPEIEDGCEFMLTLERVVTSGQEPPDSWFECVTEALRIVYGRFSEGEGNTEPGTKPEPEPSPPKKPAKTTTSRGETIH